MDFDFLLYLIIMIFVAITFFFIDYDDTEYEDDGEWW